MNKLTYRYPGGESYEDLVARLEPVIMELERSVGTTCYQCCGSVDPDPNPTFHFDADPDYDRVLPSMLKNLKYF